VVTKTAKVERIVFQVVGYDRLDDSWYSIGSFKTYELAKQAALKNFKELEKLQPSSLSGGQTIIGIQDEIYVVPPSGEMQRILPRKIGNLPMQMILPIVDDKAKGVWDEKEKLRP